MLPGRPPYGPDSGRTDADHPGWGGATPDEGRRRLRVGSSSYDRGGDPRGDEVAASPDQRQDDDVPGLPDQRRMSDQMPSWRRQPEGYPEGEAGQGSADSYG